MSDGSAFRYERYQQKLAERILKERSVDYTNRVVAIRCTFGNVCHEANEKLVAVRFPAMFVPSVGQAGHEK